MGSSAPASGTSPMPSPISWPPSGQWDGDDGKWSSFALRIGKPEQIVRVLISTASADTWVVLPGGLPPGQPGTDDYPSCSELPGNVFDPSRSSSWIDIGNYSLSVEGYENSVEYGTDIVALGSSNDTGGPILNSQVVAALETYLYCTGIFGLGRQPTNFTNLSDPNNLTDTIPYPSFLATLKDLKLIPSLSWAYTAGAPYRLKGVFGSLTFGGSDLSRYVPNSVSFDLAPDISRDILVSLESISLTTATRIAVPLLPKAILTFIDSTLPFIYLPLETCEAFEAELGLTYDSITGLYPVNDTLYLALIAIQPTFKFSIGGSIAGGPTVDIVLPYASFDFHVRSYWRDVVSYPRVSNMTRFFPLKRSTNETQYTLGRIFLQEAYLITNYEHSNFSIHQANFEGDLSKQIVAIPSADATTPSANATIKPGHSNRVSRGAIAGASVGTVMSFLVLIFILNLALRKARGRVSKQNRSNRSTGSFEPSHGINTSHIICEIDNNSLYWGRREIPDTGKAELLDEQWPSGSGKLIQEMPPHSPAELMTREYSPESPLVQNPNGSATFVSKGGSRENGTSPNDSEELPRINTLVSSPLRRPLTERSSSRPPSRNPDGPSIRPLRRQPLDLNRSLPPTPISASPSFSPAATSFSTRFTIGDYFHAPSHRTSVAPFTRANSECLAETMIAKIGRLHRRPELSYPEPSSAELEIATPRGVSESRTLLSRVRRGEHPSPPSPQPVFHSLIRPNIFTSRTTCAIFEKKPSVLYFGLKTCQRGRPSMAVRS